MFRRPPPEAAPPIPPARTRPGKVLPVIPFSPDWAERPVMPAANELPSLHEEFKLHVAGSDLPPLIFTEADPASRDVICGLARLWGYEVIATVHGRQALEEIRMVNRAAIVLVNEDMGGMDGVEFCEALRATKKPVYTIVVTERSVTGQLSNVLSGGTDDYLITPFDAHELKARLRAAARIIRLQAELAARVADLQAPATAHPLA